MSQKYVKKVTKSDIQKLFSVRALKTVPLRTFGLIEKIVLNVLLRLLLPLRIVALFLIGSGYVNLLIYRGIIISTLTIAATIFVAANIRKWNAKLKFMM